MYDTDVPDTLLENYTYIRNTNDQFRKYWAVIKGKELFCYKEKES
jgi:hypothetical protein